MNIEHAFLAQHVPAFLESPYKPFLLFIVFVPWAWLVSSKLDKDARYFHLNVVLWNSIHLAAGAAALAAMLFIPIFWIGWPAGIVLLVTPILIYWQHRNQNVPDSQRFTFSGETLSAKVEARRQAKASREAMIQFIDTAGKTRKVPLKEDPLYPVHMTAEDLLGPALDARASALEIAVGKNGCNVSQFIDGIRYKREPASPEAALHAIDYIKDIAGLDVEDRRCRQTGEFSMQGPSGATTLTATTAGSSEGQLLRIEFDRAKRLNRPFDALGLLPSQMEPLKALTEAHERHGIVLVGAPAGNGLTTTMYSLVGRHDAFTSNIKTLEREVQLELDGVDHVQWDATNPDIDYATHLQSMLRRDPDVVSVGLVLDRETASIITEPGMQGPLLYVPQRSATIGEQIRDWVKATGDIKRATRALRVVMNQRLMRSLCPNCRQAYQPTPEQLKKLNLPASKVAQLYRPSGKVQVKNKIENCAVCGGRGYLGQLGIFEVFSVDDESRKLLAGGDLKAALAHARRNKMIYLQEAALSKVANGETTIEEVVRVTAPSKSNGDKPRTQAPAATTG